MVPTRDIAVFAAIVASFDLFWTLYSGAIRDRARIAVKVSEANIISVGGPTIPILDVTVSNRGRRATTITHIGRVAKVRTGGYELSADIMRQGRVRLDEGESHSFHHGAQGGYAHGDLPLKRWFATDGAGRVYPLRERYRQRVERVVFWPFRWGHERQKRSN